MMEGEMTIMFSDKEYKGNKGIPQTFPFSFLNRKKAMSYHGQTLERLNERGGLCATEIVYNITDIDYHSVFKMKEVDALRIIIEKLT